MQIISGARAASVLMGRPGPRRYGVALAALGLALLLWLLGPLIGDATPFLVALSLVTAITWYGGLGLGLAAALLAALVLGFFVLPSRHSHTTSETLVRLGVFALTSTVISALVTAQRRASAALRESESRLRFLAGASELLSSSLDYQATLGHLAHLAVPALADWCAVDVLDKDGLIQPLIAAHVDPAKVEWARELRRRYPPDASAPRGVPQVVRTGASEIYAEIPDGLLVESAIDDEHLKILRAVGLSSALIVPLMARGRTLGALSLIAAESGRHYTEQDLVLAEDLARRAALAIDNARLYHEAEGEIAERRRLEEELRQRAEELLEADRQKDAFLAMLGHELRTPMSVIDSALQLLRRGGEDAGSARIRERVERQTRRMARLIDDLQDATRVSRGLMTLSRRTVDLARLVRESADDQRGTLEEKGLALVVDVPGEPVWVDGDPDRLGQVMANLLDNATKFTDRGGRVTVRLTVEGQGSRVKGQEARHAEASTLDPRPSTLDCAVLTVRDTGIGIGPETLLHVFKSFIQGEQSLERSRGGLGLGLALVKGLVELHGGEVQAASRGRGHGTEITVRLPAVERPAERATSGEDRGAPSAYRTVAHGQSDAMSPSGEDRGNDAISAAKELHPDRGR